MITPDLLQVRLADFAPHLDEFLQDRLILTQLPGAEEMIAAPDYLVLDQLQARLEAFAKARGIPDLAIAASLWSKHYNNALIPAVLPAMTLLGVGLNASLENVSLVLKNHIPQAIALHQISDAVIYAPRWGRGAVPQANRVGECADLYRFVLRSLFEHLSVAIAHINQLTRLPPSVMWGNTGNVCDYLYEELANCPGGAIAAQIDRAMLFEQSANPAGAGRNPLYQTVVCKTAKHADGSAPITLRRTCCLLFRMPNSHYCGNCPIKSRADGVSVLSDKPLSKGSI
jgi:ferric iron reductase protein FhuF